MIDNAGLIVSENGLDAVRVALSMTCTVKLKEPAVVGEPLIVPADSVRPGGNAPTLTDHA